MPIIEGTDRLKVFRGEYDFAQDGGAISTIPLRGANSLGGALPAGAIIWDGYIEVDTILTGASATVALQAEAAGDLLAAAAISGAPWSTTGRKAIIPVGTAAASVKTTVPRALSMVIAAGSGLTAGKFRVVLFVK